MTLQSGTVTDLIMEDITDSIELLPLEHSTSAVWKHSDFPVKTEELLIVTKRNNGEFTGNARFVDVTIHMLAMQVACGSI